MTTALRIIERAFSKIGVRASETPLTASEVEDGLDTLNDLLSEWGTTGTLKGAVPVSGVGVELEIPRYSLGAVKANLAIRLAPEYDRPVTQGMAFDATDSVNKLVKAEINLSNVPFPGTLPVGEANTDGQEVITGRDFFPEGKHRNF